jgi:predicted transcriptional regulator
MARKYEELRSKLTPGQRAASARLTKQLSDELPLHQLRHALLLTQEQIAESLGVSQGAISKMENQSDMLISTLQRIIEAMGGELELRVRFPQGEVTLKDLGHAAA